jgi:hypothetical protein
MAQMNSNTVKGRLSGNGTPQDIPMSDLPISTPTQTALDSKRGLTGNAGTNPTTDFIGTTDNQPFVVRTNNVESFRVATSGNVEVKTGFRLGLSLTFGQNTSIRFEDTGLGGNGIVYNTHNALNPHKFLVGNTEKMRLKNT